MKLHAGWTAGIALASALALGWRAQDPQAPAKELQTIEQEFQKEQKELRAAAKAADGEDAVEELYRDFQTKIVPEFAERYATLARANKGTPTALSGWIKVVELVSQGLQGPVAGEALDTLVRDHIQAEELRQVPGFLRYSAQPLGEEKALAALRAMAEHSPHRTVQAAALYNLGAVLGEDRPAGDPRLVEAKAALTKLASYTDVKYGDKTYAEAAAGYLFALENLVPGRPCPDFGASDAEGVGFKLSDYKGKVVMVDFWGFW